MTRNQEELRQQLSTRANRLVRLLSFEPVAPDMIVANEVALVWDSAMVLYGPLLLARVARTQQRRAKIAMRVCEEDDCWNDAEDAGRLCTWHKAQDERIARGEDPPDLLDNPHLGEDERDFDAEHDPRGEDPPDVPEA